MKEQMAIKQKTKSAQMDLKMKFYYINGVWRSFHILSIFMIVKVKKRNFISNYHYIETQIKWFSTRMS